MILNPHVVLAIVFVLMTSVSEILYLYLNKR
jgi:hypothetical protein